MSAAKDPRKPAFRISAKALAVALKDVCEVCQPATKTTIPILSGVLIEVADGAAVFTATDLDMCIMRSVATADRDGPDSAAWLAGIKPFAFVIPARPLLAIAKEIDGDAMVQLCAPDAGETRATIKAGRSRFRINCLPVDDMPLPKRGDYGHSFSLPATRLRDVFASVEHAISTEETRYYLNGIYMHAEGLDQRFAATDGHRMARRVIDGADGVASFPAVIIGRQTVAVLDKLLDAADKCKEGDAPAMVEIEADANGRAITWMMPAADGGEATLIAKTIDGSFPDCARVIPQGHPNTLTIARDMLAAAIKRVATVAESKTRIVKLDLAEGLATVSSASTDIGEASEDLAAEYSGAAMTVGFDSRYWRDALGAVATDKVVMRFSDPGAPVLIEAEATGDEVGLVQVLMPVRV